MDTLTQEIYEKGKDVGLVNTELSFGCMVIGKDFVHVEDWEGYKGCQEDHAFHNYGIMLNSEYLRNLSEEKEDYYGGGHLNMPDEFDKFEIIGHPLMIGDMLDWVDNNNFDDMSIYENLRFYWKEKRLPIDDQSYACKKYILELIEDFKSLNK